MAVTRVYPDMATGNWSDEDWGSAGPACIFAIKVCVAAGKDGIGYPIRTDNLGGTTVADLSNAPANCKKLAAAPVWLTMSPGPVDPCPANPTTLNFFPWGDSAHLHMTPVQFFDPVLNSWTIFVWGENAQLHKWAVSSTGALTYVAQSREYASANVMRGHAGVTPAEPTGGHARRILLRIQQRLRPELGHPRLHHPPTETQTLKSPTAAFWSTTLCIWPLTIR